MPGNQTRDAPVNAIELSAVTLALGGRTILSGIDIAVKEQEFVGLLGANGAGKTTLLRAILGLVPPVSGQIRVLGAPAMRGQRAVGYLPQARSAASGTRLSGRDFVAAAVNGHRWGLPLLGAAGRRDVDRALGLVGAAGLSRRPLAELSGGERQRLLLAQALLGQPHLLLLDEPLMSLDPHHQRGVVELVRHLQRELSLAVVFSAHELNPLLGAMDRVLYLGGTKAAIGGVDEVITGPVLSRLYGSHIHVARLDGRIFVMSGGHEVDRDDHRHHNHAHDAHA
jgi:zinc/manganese transport system ATP-binding protein